MSDSGQTDTDPVTDADGVCKDGEAVVGIVEGRPFDSAIHGFSGGCRRGHAEIIHRVPVSLTELPELACDKSKCKAAAFLWKTAAILNLARGQVPSFFVPAESRIPLDRCCSGMQEVTVVSYLRRERHDKGRIHHP